MAAAEKKPVDKKMQEQEHEITDYGYKRYNICGMAFETTRSYAVRKAVGQGAYGLVCSGRNVESNKLVAIKKIPKAFEDTIDCKRLLREIKILRHFRHENVLGLVDILPPPSGGKDGWKDVYIVSELMDTDLHYIIHSKQPLTDEHFKYFLYQIMRGVHAIHSAHVLHRDLKPGNLLVNKNCDLKICDFGLARAVNPEAEAKDLGLTEYVVTRWYRAPELLVENQARAAATPAPPSSPAIVNAAAAPAGVLDVDRRVGGRLHLRRDDRAEGPLPRPRLPAPAAADHRRARHAVGGGPRVHLERAGGAVPADAAGEAAQAMVRDFPQR